MSSFLDGVDNYPTTVHEAYTVIDNTFKQTLILLIGHLEEEEFKVIYQNSIRLTISSFFFP